MEILLIFVAIVSEILYNSGMKEREKPTTLQHHIRSNIMIYYFNKDLVLKSCNYLAEVDHNDHVQFYYNMNRIIDNMVGCNFALVNTMLDSKGEFFHTTFKHMDEGFMVRISSTGSFMVSDELAMDNVIKAITRAIKAA